MHLRNEREIRGGENHAGKGAEKMSKENESKKRKPRKKQAPDFHDIAGKEKVEKIGIYLQSVIPIVLSFFSMDVEKITKGELDSFEKTAMRLRLLASRFTKRHARLTHIVTGVPVVINAKRLLSGAFAFVSCPTCAERNLPSFGVPGSDCPDCGEKFPGKRIKLDAETIENLKKLPLKAMREQVSRYAFDAENRPKK